MALPGHVPCADIGGDDRGHTGPTHGPTRVKEAHFGVEQVLRGVDLGPTRPEPRRPVGALKRGRGVASSGGLIRSDSPTARSLVRSTTAIRSFAVANRTP